MATSHVCPAERAGMLDSWFRKLIQNPDKIVSPYLRSGMKAADIGCGPGFFTLPMARMVTSSGRVYGYDLQEEMLAKIEQKIEGSAVADSISLKATRQDKIGFVEQVDFVLAFYMVHETTSAAALFKEVYLAMNGGGTFLVVEPLFHVSKSDFQAYFEIAEKCGFVTERGPQVFFSRSAVFRKRDR